MWVYTRIFVLIHCWPCQKQMVVNVVLYFVLESPANTTVTIKTVQSEYLYLPSLLSKSRKKAIWIIRVGRVLLSTSMSQCVFLLFSLNCDGLLIIKVNEQAEGGCSFLFLKPEGPKS